MSLPEALQQRIEGLASRATTGAASAVKLRYYQDEAIASILGAHADGTQRPLIVCATGTGKTVIFSELIRRKLAGLDRRGRAVVIAHRDELIDQAVEKLLHVWPGADVGIVKAAKNDVDAEVMAASIQTLARPKRMAALLAHGPLDLIVVDEAHHAGAKSYRDALARLGAFTKGGPLCVGVTATPKPKDADLAKVWDRVVYEYDMGQGVDDGYLTNLVGVQVEVADLDLSRVDRVQGDYRTDQLGQAMHDANAPEIVAKALIEEAPGRKSLVFVPTVALAHETAAAMVAAGIRAKPISGETPKEDTTGEDGELRFGRRSLYRQLRSGEIDALVNAQLLTEGFDEPSVDCVVVARPTQSRVMYVQMVGRGTRLFPGKDDCLVLDLMGASKKHSLMSLGELLGAKGAKGRKVNMREERERAATEREAAMEYEQRQLAIEMRTKRVQLLARFTWVAVDRGFAMALPDSSLLAIMQVDEDYDDSWRVGVMRPGNQPNERIADGHTLEMAQGIAEDYARGIEGVGRLRGKDAGWRRKPASDKQVAAARARGIEVTDGATAGEVSDMLTAHTVEVALARRAA